MKNWEDEVKFSLKFFFVLNSRCNFLQQHFPISNILFSLWRIAYFLIFWTKKKSNNLFISDTLCTQPQLLKLLHIQSSMPFQPFMPSMQFQSLKLHQLLHTLHLSTPIMQFMQFMQHQYWYIIRQLTIFYYRIMRPDER